MECHLSKLIAASGPRLVDRHEHPLGLLDQRLVLSRVADRGGAGPLLVHGQISYEAANHTRGLTGFVASRRAPTERTTRDWPLASTIRWQLLKYRSG
jgi:hypothetical protein